MPYIIPTARTKSATSAIEEFDQLVAKYKHVIENNASARCMIGFTAASVIRSEGEIDIDSVEQWLKSMETNNSQEAHQMTLNSDDDTFQVNKNNVDTILNVVKRTAATYWNQDYQEEEEELGSDNSSEYNEDESDFEFVAEDEEEKSYALSRFISHNPYTTTTSRYSSKYSSIFVADYQLMGQSSFHFLDDPSSTKLPSS